MQVLPWNSLLVSSVETRLWNSLSCVRINANANRNRFLLQSIRRLSNIHSSQLDFFFIRNEGYLPKLRRFTVKLKKVVKFSVNFKDSFPVIFFRLVVGVILFMAVTVPVAKSPSCKFLLFVSLMKLNAPKYITYQMLSFVQGLLLKRIFSSWRHGEQLTAHMLTKPLMGKVGLGTEKMHFAMNQ